MAVGEQLQRGDKYARRSVIILQKSDDRNSINISKNESASIAMTFVLWIEIVAALWVFNCQHVLALLGLMVLIRKFTVQ